MSARVFYTRDEDTLLVKYIAKYNPTGKGRAGNTLYRKLCDDADNKWKWSRNHSWQSWRDRYYKNQEQFDEKIKAYQKKHGISAADPDELEKARDDAGSAEDDDKDTGEDEAESSAAPGKRKRAYEDEKKRARMKYDSKPSQERRVSQGKRPEVFVKGKGTKLADMHDEKDKDIRSKSESGRNPSDVDQGRVLKTHAGDVQGKEKVKPSTTGEPRNVNERAQIEPSASQSLYPDVTKLPAPNSGASPPPAPEQPTIPGEYNDKPLPSTQAIRQRRHEEPQPEASSSKVKLSPSHRISGKSSISLSRQKRLTKEDDFFASSPPIPSPPTPSPPSRPDKAHTKHRFPTLVEGPFGRHHFPGRRKGTVHDESSDEGEKQEAWPPPRKRHSSSMDKGKAKEVLREVMKEKSPVEKTASVQKPSKAETAHIQADAAPTADPPVHALAEASFSRTARIDREGKESIPSGTRRHAEQPGHPKSPPRADKPPTIQLTKGLTSKSDSIQSTVALSRSGSGATIPADSETSSSVIEKQLARTLPRTSWTPGDPFVAHPTRDGSNIKNATRAETLLTRRHTLNDTHEIRNITGRRIDLRTELAKRQHSRSSPAVHSRAPSVATTTHHSPLSNGDASSPTTGSATRRRSSLLPITVAEEDREQIEYLGVLRAIELIGKNFGFRDEVVLKAWKELKNIAHTEEFFRRLQQKYPNVQDDVLDEMERDGVDLGALVTQQEDEDPKLQPKPEPEPEPRHVQHREQERDWVHHSTSATSSSTSNKRSSPNRRTQERDLKIKPLPVERALSEYTPPYMSRAGQYVRLVKQGRKEEAISREKRRASGGSGVFPKLRSVSATQESPQHQTSYWGREAESDGAREEMEEDAASDQAPEEVDATATVVGDGPLREELREEEECAFLSATSGEAAELRKIEQGIDVDFMMRWTAAQLGQLAQAARGSPRPS